MHDTRDSTHVAGAAAPAEEGTEKSAMDSDARGEYSAENGTRARWRGRPDEGSFQDWNVYLSGGSGGPAESVTLRDSTGAASVLTNVTPRVENEAEHPEDGTA